MWRISNGIGFFNAFYEFIQLDEERCDKHYNQEDTDDPYIADARVEAKHEGSPYFLRGIAFNKSPIGKERIEKYIRCDEDIHGHYEPERSLAYERKIGADISTGKSQARCEYHKRYIKGPELKQ